MVRYGKRTIGFAIALSVLAGFIDSVGYLRMGGYFVSFMSGNSTRLGVGAGSHNGPQALAALGLIFLFVIGVILGSLLGHRFPATRRRSILLLVTTLIGAAFLFAHTPWTMLAMGPLVLAMGSMNAVFERDGEVSIGVTYMTGTLVKMGQRIAHRLAGKGTTSWTPYAMLWLGLVFGASIGSFSFLHLGTYSLGIAVTFAGAMAVVERRIPSA